MRCRSRLLIAMVATAIFQATGIAYAQFSVVEASISEAITAMEEGETTAVDLVQQSLDRIAAYDNAGPAINAVITINPMALQRAQELDDQLAKGEVSGPLHGIPIVVKDNFDTADMPTSAGSLSLRDSIPPDDAFQVQRLRAAGAIIIAKTNMYEFAFSPYETVGSNLPGHTRNPYALNRVPAGSSGGTAASVAASFALAGLGTDTGNSIRGPSSHNALVGIRSTMGLTSRDGIVPLDLEHDVGGPMARSVADAALLLDVIAGYDDADPITVASRNRGTIRYRDQLISDSLRGARIGVLRQLANRDDADTEVLKRFDEALDMMRNAGATIEDSIHIDELEQLVPPVDGDSLSVWCSRFRFDLENYLASLGHDAPVRTLEEIIDSGNYHPKLDSDLKYFQDQAPPEQNQGCIAAMEGRARLRAAVKKVFGNNNLDALVYPSWSNPPRLIGDLNTPHGDNSQHVSPHTGFPSITVPMGYVGETLPVGLQLVGDAFTEATLIRLAYAFEQMTQHRMAPASTPPLLQ